MKCESLRSLVVCRGFLHDPVVKALMAVQEDERQGDSFSRRAGAAVLLEAAERLGLRGNVLRQYFFYLFGEGRTVATLGMYDPSKDMDTRLTVDAEAAVA